jgi:hypothetical protein
MEMREGLGAAIPSKRWLLIRKHTRHPADLISAKHDEAMMHNKITLIGTMADRPQEMYDPDANRCVLISLIMLPPPDAPPTHWGLTFDLRPPGSGSGWPVGDDTFLVIGHYPLLVEKCLQSLHKGDVICVEGRLVLTLLRSDGDIVPLAEILASDVILLTKDVSHSS